MDNDSCETHPTAFKDATDCNKPCHPTRASLHSRVGDSGRPLPVMLTHRVQLDPTVKQVLYFVQACGAARFTWNWALAEWKRQYEAGIKPKATVLKREFNAIKYERFPWLKRIHRDAHAQPFAQLAVAFGRFFSSHAEYPKFKKKGQCRDSFYVANDQFRVGGRWVRLPLVGNVRMRESLRFAGRIQSATVSREADRWFISIAVELGDAPLSPPQERQPIGVDLGLTTFATLSTGEKIIAPKPLKKAQARLRRLNRNLARRQRGSKNRKKAAMRVARHHRRVRNIRQDFLHKFTTGLAKEHGEIFIEDLNVSGMLKNHKLALHISDAAWAETRRQLQYKAVLHGSKITVRDRFYPSSRLCSYCGAKAIKMPLSIRVWRCGNCGTVHDRDHNAAINLSQPTTAGYAGSHASGEIGAVRPLKERGTLPCVQLGAQER